MVDAEADRDDAARDLEPGNVGGARRRRIFALALQHVGPVDAGGLDRDQHLARAGMRHRPCRRRSISGPPGARDLDRGGGGGKAGHGGRSSRSLRRAIAPLAGSRHTGNRAPSGDGIWTKKISCPSVSRQKKRDLAPMAIAELEAYIAVLEGEIARARAEIAAKRKQRGGAEALFKR